MKHKKFVSNFCTFVSNLERDAISNEPKLSKAQFEIKLRDEIFFLVG